MKRKISAIAMALIIAVSCFVTAFAAEADLVISTPEALDAFAAAVNAGNSFEGKTVVLGSDISVSDSFVPVGKKNAPFSGTFDGNGKTVSGISLDCDYAGLFGYTDGAEISALTVSGEFDAESYAGAVAAYAKDTVIENCICESGVYAFSYAGGIAGYIESGKIADCESTDFAAVYGYSEATGGIAGFSGADIEGCKNNAAISGVKNVGGIVGEAAGNITSCENLVAVYASSMNLGGIAGICDGEIAYCVNKGKVSPEQGASVSNAGGIAGMLRGASVKESASYAAVNATGNFAGGIAGYATDSTITDCIMTSDVVNTALYAGGIFGCALKSNVTKCVAVSSVTAKNSTDGGVGAVAQGTVSDCYYSVSEERAVVQGTASAVKTGDFTDKSALSALDFNKTWTINEFHASYPLLQKLSYHTFINVEEKEADCVNGGYFKAECEVCLEKINITYPATGHSFTVVSSKAPTCTEDGFEDGLCSVCNTAQTVILSATGHSDADSDGVCDICKADLSEKNDSEMTIFEKIAEFFNKILQWLKNLFS